MKIKFERTLYYELDTDSDAIVNIIREHSLKTKEQFPTGYFDTTEFNVNKHTINEDLGRLYIFLHANAHMAKVTTGDYINNITIDE